MSEGVNYQGCINNYITKKGCNIIIYTPMNQLRRTRSVGCVRTDYIVNGHRCKRGGSFKVWIKI